MSGALRLPARGEQAAAAVVGERHVGGAEVLTVPQLAGDLLVAGVEGLAGGIVVQGQSWANDVL